MKVIKKQQQGQLNCFQKLETLNEKLKQLAEIMNEMREGLQQRRAERSR
jgi:hypothetical protein